MDLVAFWVESALGAERGNYSSISSQNPQSPCPEHDAVRRTTISLSGARIAISVPGALSSEPYCDLRIRSPMFYAELRFPDQEPKLQSLFEEPKARYIGLLYKELRSPYQESELQYPLVEPETLHRTAISVLKAHRTARYPYPELELHLPLRGAQSSTPVCDRVRSPLFYPRTVGLSGSYE